MYVHCTKFECAMKTRVRRESVPKRAVAAALVEDASNSKNTLGI